MTDKTACTFLIVTTQGQRWEGARVLVCDGDKFAREGLVHMLQRERTQVSGRLLFVLSLLLESSLEMV